jgi:hypothetical protein
VCGRCVEGADNTCRYNDAGKPIRVAHYFALEEHIRAVFQSKALAKEAKYAWNRPAPADANMADRELQDVWDGSILHDLYHDPDDRVDPQSTLYFSLSFDGVEIKNKVRCCLFVFVPAHRSHSPSPYRCRTLPSCANS